MKMSFQYAKLPAFKYQTFDPQYQTFDRQTLKFSFYPVIDKPSQHLTPDKDQENKPNEPEKDPASDNAPADGSTTADNSSAPEPAGELVPILPQCALKVHVGVRSPFN